MLIAGLIIKIKQFSANKTISPVQGFAGEVGVSLRTWDHVMRLLPGVAVRAVRSNFSVQNRIIEWFRWVPCSVCCILADPTKEISTCWFV